RAGGRRRRRAGRRSIRGAGNRPDSAGPGQTEMKPPPFLLGAALIFWGWQSDLLLPGALMAVAIESARFVQTRWDLADEDFSRIWTFCGLLLLAAAVYAFASTDGPANFTGLFAHPNLRSERSAGISTA